MIDFLGLVPCMVEILCEMKPVSTITLLPPLFEVATGATLEAPGSQGAQVVMMVVSLRRFGAPPPLNTPPPSAGCDPQPSKPSRT